MRSECVRCDDCERLYDDQKKCVHWVVLHRRVRISRLVRASRPEAGGLQPVGWRVHDLDASLQSRRHVDVVVGANDDDLHVWHLRRQCEPPSGPSRKIPLLIPSAITGRVTTVTLRGDVSLAVRLPDR